MTSIGGAEIEIEVMMRMTMVKSHTRGISSSVSPGSTRGACDIRSSSVLFPGCSWSLCLVFVRVLLTCLPTALFMQANLMLTKTNRPSTLHDAPHRHLDLHHHADPDDSLRHYHLLPRPRAHLHATHGPQPSARQSQRQRPRTRWRRRLPLQPRHGRGPRPRRLRRPAPPHPRRARSRRGSRRRSGRGRRQARTPCLWRLARECQDRP